MRRSTRTVYGELRRIAGAHVGHQGGRAPVQATSLVHEAFLRLAGASEVRYEDRLHFFRTAARAMRSVVVDLARARAAAKRGGDRVRVTLDEWGHGASDTVIEVLEVHEALQRLEALDAAAANVVELRFFAGLTPAETAAALDLNERTVFRIWNRARAWLHREISA